MQGKGIVRPDLFFNDMDRTVGDHDIRPTIIVVVYERCTKSCKGLCRDVEPGHGACILELAAMTQVAIKSRFFAGKMSDEDIFVPGAVDIGDIDTHARFSRSIDIYCHATLKRFIVKRAILLVYPELIGIAVIGNEDIWPAIAIQVRSNHSETVANSLGYPRLDRDILECSISEIMIEDARHRPKRHGSAVVACTRKIVALPRIRH